MNFYKVQLVIGMTVKKEIIIKTKNTAAKMQHDLELDYEDFKQVIASRLGWSDYDRTKDTHALFIMEYIEPSIEITIEQLVDHKADLFDGANPLLVFTYNVGEQIAGEDGEYCYDMKIKDMKRQTVFDDDIEIRGQNTIESILRQKACDYYNETYDKDWIKPQDIHLIHNPTIPVHGEICFDIK